MNNLLELRGQFGHFEHPKGGMKISLPANASFNPVTIEHLTKLKIQLEKILNYWKADTLINGALVTVYYREIVAKSNRLGRLLKDKIIPLNDSIRGVKFNDTFEKHIFTYFVSLKTLKSTIMDLEKAIVMIEENFGNRITKDELEKLAANSIDYSLLKKTAFCQIVKDAYFVEAFDINRELTAAHETSIISIYKTGVDTKNLLYQLGIDLINEKMLDETTIRLGPEEIAILLEKAPYLIAMKTTDLSLIKKEDFNYGFEESMSIPPPKNEPIIGVIDTLFDKNAYFSDWVDYVEYVNEDIPKMSDDYSHGTAVSSIIVDGPQINPELDDGCGRFRVKHFGVAIGSKFSSFSIMKSIRLAVKENPHIKVWNISLGSSLEVNPNFISPEAAELDKIQSEYDVVFVIAGTNGQCTNYTPMKIGAPADSINSIVVNAVNSNKEPVSYRRVGPVLSFFYKPDISYYGGDINDKIKVYSNNSICTTCGTSFAAPWISRKMAYLMQVLGFNREVAKALLIDAAAGWDRKDSKLCDTGYGVVPINIKDIVSSNNDEIKFIFSGATENYETSAYNIPIPLNSEAKYPFITRATLCYYPKCSRNQGVDYTSTEINFQFGRVQRNNKGKVTLKTFDKNTQGEEFDKTKEVSARANWRKWDNIKHLAPLHKGFGKGIKKSYEGELCGVKMTVKDRLSTQHTTIPFGIVITLKEVNGINRIGEFIKLCNIKGWYVKQLNIENQIEINNIAEEEIEFD